MHGPITNADNPPIASVPGIEEAMDDSPAVYQPINNIISTATAIQVRLSMIRARNRINPIAKAKRIQLIKLLMQWPKAGVPEKLENVPTTVPSASPIEGLN